MMDEKNIFELLSDRTLQHEERIGLAIGSGLLDRDDLNRWADAVIARAIYRLRVGQPVDVFTSWSDAWLSGKNRSGVGAELYRKACMAEYNRHSGTLYMVAASWVCSIAEIRRDSDMAWFKTISHVAIIAAGWAANALGNNDHHSAKDSEGKEQLVELCAILREKS